MSDDLAIWTGLVAVATLLFAWAVQSVLRIGPLSVPGTGPATLYLTASAGRTSFLTGAQRRAHWRQAIAYISRLLRLRRRFHDIGQYLKQTRIQGVLEGIARQKKVLRRTSAAETPCPTTPETMSSGAPLPRARARRAM